MDTRIHDVTDTSIWVAAGRASESARPDALFHDPLAAKLIGKRGEAMMATSGWSYALAWTMGVRTVLIDDYIRRAISEGCDTVVNLGCGLDTRPYRMDLPQDLRWVEVDFPKVISHKDALLSDERPRCRLERHAADLSIATERQRILNAIASQSKKAIVITEGVVPYLSVEAAGDLADDLRGHACFKWWVVDYISGDIMKRVQTGRIRKRMGSARLLFNPENWTEFFSVRGWKINQVRYLVDEGEKIGRPFKKTLLMYLIALVMMRGNLDRLIRSIGYALLEAKG